MKVTKKYKKGGKVKGYEDGGSVPLGLKDTPSDYIAKPQRKQKGNFGDYAADVGRLAAKSALSMIGADNLVNDRFRTQVGADANSIRNKYIEPIQQAVASVGVNALLPGAGQLYNVGIGMVDSASRKRLPGESDTDYSRRMENLGVDITDQPTGFEGLIKSGAEFGLAQMLANGGSVRYKKQCMATGGKVGGGETPAKTSSTNVNAYESFYKKLNKYDKINPLDLNTANDVKKDIGTIIAPRLKNYNSMLRQALEKKYKLEPGSAINDEYLGLDEMKSILGNNFNDYIQSFDAYQAYRSKTADVAPPRNTAGTEDTNKYVFGKRNAGLFDPYVDQSQGDGMKDGGKVKGPGTAKSDSIDAEVEQGSFVVPAENAHLAEEIREKYLGDGNEKANLNQGGNASKVKLSNGEHLFSAHEYEFLKKMGVNLDALAPNADSSNGYKEGGSVDEMRKAREGRKKSNEDAASKKKSDASRREADEIRSNLANIEDDMRKIAAAYKRGDSKYSGVDIDEAADKLENMYKVQSDRYKKATGKNYGNTQEESSGGQKTTNLDTKTGGSGNTQVPKGGKASVPAGNGGKSSSVSGSSSKNNKSSQKESASEVLGEIAPKRINEVKGGNPTRGAIAKRDAFGDMQNPATAPVSSSKSRGNKPSLTLEDVLAGGQILTGALALASDGKRPVDTANKNFENSINQAKMEANYGFDSATKALYEKNIEGARMDVINLAGQNAGGNPQNALAQARAATNQYAGNMLDFAAADARFKLDKQRYRDSLIQNEVQQQRQRFEDKLRAFDINQQSGAELISAGIENILGSRRAQRNNEMLENISKNSQIII